MRLTHLFSPLTIRSVEIRNRIFSTGHQVNMLTGGVPNARLAAYHEARAAGGAGLIVTEAARVHGWEARMVPSMTDDAEALPVIARKSQIPVIADIHFQPKYVFAAIDAGWRWRGRGSESDHSNGAAFPRHKCRRDRLAAPLRAREQEERNVAR